MNQEFQNQLISENIVTPKGRWHKGSPKRLRESSLYPRVLELTHFLDYATERERVNCVLYDVTEPPTCLYCGKGLPIQILYDRQIKYCGPACANIDPKKKELTRQSLLATHGVEHNSQIEAVKLSKKSKALRDYGVDNVFKSEVIKQSSRETLFKDHGYEYVSQIPEFREKVKNTTYSRHGILKNKNPALSEKMVSKINDPKWLRRVLKEVHPAVLSDELGCDLRIILARAEAQGIEWIDYHPRSVLEGRVLSVLRDNYDGEICLHDRVLISPAEVDMYLPGLNLAIECNGDYWHGEKFTSRLRHQQKTFKCLQQGVRLIHLSESEWHNKNAIVISRLRSLINAVDILPVADCDAVSCDFQQARRFFEATHMQGFTRCSHYSGLTYQGVLVAMLGYGKCKHRKGVIEVKRYSSHLNFSVKHGLATLLSEARKLYNFQDFIVHCDMRWCTGNTYEDEGFVFEKFTPADYAYARMSQPPQTFSRLKFQKHMLADKLDRFDPDKSEYENMLDNGYDRIWDAGNAVFIQHPPKET